MAEEEDQPKKNEQDHALKLRVIWNKTSNCNDIKNLI